MYGRYTRLPEQSPQYFQQHFHDPQFKYPDQHVYELNSPWQQPVQSPPYASPYGLPYSTASVPITHGGPGMKIVPLKPPSFDWGTTILLFLVWAFLCLSCVVLLFFAYAVSTDDSGANEAVPSQSIAGIIALSSAPILVATILNEVLVDRAWRRVAYSALGRDVINLHPRDLAQNLRAANFEWLNFLKRFFLCRLTSKDIKSFASYALLRWGTAVSIAAVQFCVSWRPVGSDPDTGMYTYTAHKRYILVIAPAVLHACCIFGAMLIWLMPPWTFFSGKFDDNGLLLQYIPYLQRVQEGSIATYDDVAKFLESAAQDSDRQRLLYKKNKPGLQTWAKIKGIWWGLLNMNFPPLLAWVVFRWVEPDDVLTVGVYRFMFHFVFLAQNIFYLLALDFVVWNLSLEGFCKTNNTGAANPNLRHLGYSSGIIQLLRVLKQRRPLRALIFSWLFWLQACAMRTLTALYTLCIAVLTYGTYNQRKTLYDPNFWLGWIVMTGALTLPLFVIWLFTKSEAPVCEQDGWRWAKIAEQAQAGPGYYGVKYGVAIWDMDVKRFSDESVKGKKLK